jgi:hypothetical protein
MKSYLLHFGEKRKEKKTLVTYQKCGSRCCDFWSRLLQVFDFFVAVLHVVCGLHLSTTKVTIYKRVREGGREGGRDGGGRKELRGREEERLELFSISAWAFYNTLGFVSLSLPFSSVVKLSFFLVIVVVVV